MKIMLLATGLLVTALACNSSNQPNPVFNTGKITVQTFTVDVTKEQSSALQKALLS
jgi:hypothetical protein